MKFNKKFDKKLYKILSTIKYNSERGELIEEVLKKFLIEKDTKLDIAKTSRKLFSKKKKSLDEVRDETEFEDFFKSEWFKQECLILSNIPHQFVPEYIIQKFSPYAKEFENMFELKMDAVWMFAFKIMEILEFKKYMTMFKDEVYSFMSRKEYADLGFVAIPSEDYIWKWKNIITFSISELKHMLSSLTTEIEIEKILDILSLNIEDIPKDEEEIKFHVKPFLRLSKDTIVLITPWYLTRGLPSIYDILFRQCKGYIDSKGDSFEKLVQNTLKMMSFKNLGYNVKYGKDYEVDAILRFKDSVWAVEVSSHTPSSKSFKGSMRHIENDLRKSVKKCIRQGKRCISHTKEKALSSFFYGAKTKGIIVIVDGLYPQINMTTATGFFEEDLPVYVVNWFDFRTLLEQPEVALFEEFLLWRIKKPMPVISIDEKDYWAFYFDNYLIGSELGKGFKTMQDKMIRLFYSSFRFNDKRHLKKIA